MISLCHAICCIIYSCEISSNVYIYKIKCFYCAAWSWKLLESISDNLKSTGVGVQVGSQNPDINMYCIAFVYNIHVIYVCSFT